MRAITSFCSVRCILTLLLVSASSLIANLPALATPPEAVLHTFNAYADGFLPSSSLIQGKDGNYYGTTYLGGTNNEGTVFQITSSGTLTTLHSFTGLDGANPEAGVVQGSDGSLYGTTGSGGTGDSGTVFQISTDGTTFDTLHSFNGTDGYYPEAALTQGSGGNLYGTTLEGGANNAGTVFHITTNGKTFKTLHSFDSTDGAGPGGIIKGTDGNLYGTTSGGGANSDGTVFKITVSGTGFKTLHNFNGTDGAGPTTGLIQGKDGNLYGTSEKDGTEGDGTVFVLSTSGKTFNTLHNFDGTDGTSPTAGLIQGKDGNLYGTTSQGGTGSVGTVYEMSTSGTTFNTLHNFDTSDGSGPTGLVQSSDGTLTGTASYGGADNDGVLFEISTDGTTFTLLFDFANGFHDGQGPGSSLTLGSDGDYYGTTTLGGREGYGTVFKISADGTTLSILHSFNSSDGAHPESTVIQSKDGNLYGTTSGGGANSDGTVFEITSSGKLTTLHSFDGTDGASPFGGVIQSKNGTLYGTTLEGGASNEGTVFEISPNGKNFRTLHSFSGTDGTGPTAGLIQGKDGNFYGTTGSGGANNEGTVFKITSSGTLTTLHSFDLTDGSDPHAGLIQAFDNNLYGTTSQGGADNEGTVFKIGTNGKTFSTLHSFSGTDGANPYGGVIQGSDGNLYGTTNQGGSSSIGTVFELSRNGSAFTLLHSFAGYPADGSSPYSGLLEGPDGNLYGTTLSGGIPLQPGTSVQGTIYQLQTQLPLNPPLIASFSPARVKVGATVTVTGLNLASATSVTINGVAQTITSDAATSLKFIVAADTKTGPIVVTTANGSGSSLTSLVIN